ncbi:hypothetical protein AA313_de0206998 [Arthrobotrys entomopaga]|nr:hypothetical protein AA313_de0206998 [Arthrobotrys entomopaga]
MEFCGDFRHLKYTIPLAVILTGLVCPFKTGIDNYKTVYLLTIAVTATIPWDSHLLKNQVWNYPNHAVIGHTFWRIPIEELFFFVVQTYITSLVCILVGKSIIPSAYLPTLPITPPSPSIEEAKPKKAKHKIQNDYKRLRRIGLFGAISILSCVIIGARLVQIGGHGTYMGLILVWAGPIVLLLWILSHQYILSIPRRNVLIPIIFPTLYLWFVDTLALKNGTWVINPEKSFEIKIWKYLDIEEALFFLVTNTLITFGQLAFDHALAVINGFPETFNFPIPSWPSMTLMASGLSFPVKRYSSKRILDLRDAIIKLQKKSRSFSLANSVFEGRLRIDLVFLYAFCRNADDLIDEAQTPEEARKALSKLSQAVLNAFGKNNKDGLEPPLSMLYDLPEEMAASLESLPVKSIPLRPVQGLLEGFEMDLTFPAIDKTNEKTPSSVTEDKFPIRSEKDLERYGYCVAGTVAELLLNLVFHHTTAKFTSLEREGIIQAGVDMGIALQYINISRDIAKDALMGRCYLPSTWLAEYNLTPSMVVEKPDRPETRILRKRLLGIAMDIYSKNRGAIERLPKNCGARKGVRAAVENYLEIGRVLLEQDGKNMIIGENQATVSKMRRLGAFAKALWAGVGGCASAARLAKAGFKVTVVEKNDFTGGRCSLIYDGEHRFDQGPSLLLLPDLFHETFADLDTTMPAEGVHLLKCDPNYQIFFHDNEKMTLSSDLSRMKPEIERWEGKDGFERYLGFLAEGHRHYEFSMKQALRKNFPSIFSMLRPVLLKDIMRMFVFTSLYTRASAYFWTDRLRRCFTFASMYMGMSPYKAPALYSLLQYTELVEGIWYPQGGFHKVVEAIVNIGKKLGVEYQLNSPVQSILLSEDEKQAVGVVLQSGRHLQADIVLVNADLVYTYNNLLPETSYSKNLAKRPASCSSISLYWSMNRKIEELSAHNIFMAEHYKESFEEIFEKLKLPDEPSFYVNVPSRIDPTAAPDGKDSIVVLIPTGHLEEDGNGRGLKTSDDWNQLVNKAREFVIRAIESRTGVKDLRQAIAAERINIPTTCQSSLDTSKTGITKKY